MNKVILIGHLGNDPDVRYSQSGSAIANISLATQERRKNQNGEWQKYPEWHRVKFFGKLAEVVGEHLKKGQQISIVGKLRSNKYTDQDGVERRSTDIIADEMEMLGGGKDDRHASESSRKPRQQSTAASGRTANSGEAYRRAKEGQSAPPPPPQDDFDDDDIPF